MDVDLASFEFARAYLQARRHQATGSVRIPVVKDQRGKLVAVGRPVEWAAGVAAKVLCKRYVVAFLETADCYKILSSTTLETLAHDATSPQKRQLPPESLARQRSSTLFQRMRTGVYMDRGAASPSSSGSDGDVSGSCPYMEDGHLAIRNLRSPGVYEDQSLYCVIDGHGGDGALNYIREHLPDNLVQQECFAIEPELALTLAFQRYLPCSELNLSLICCSTELTVTLSPKPVAWRARALCWTLVEPQCYAC